MKTEIIRQFIGLGAVAVLFAAFSVSAHGLATTQTEEAGSYTIEFEHNSPTNVRAGEYTLFLVYLLDTETKAGQNYDSANVRIEKQNGPGVLSGNLKGSTEGLGFSSISGAIPEPGTYTASVAFYKDGKSLASSDFNFEVDPREAGRKDWVYPGAGAAIFLLGIVAGYLIKKFMK